MNTFLKPKKLKYHPEGFDSWNRLVKYKADGEENNYHVFDCIVSFFKNSSRVKQITYFTHANLVIKSIEYFKPTNPVLMPRVLHNGKGPAKIFVGLTDKNIKSEEYCIDGKFISENEHKLLLDITKLKGMTNNV